MQKKLLAIEDDPQIAELLKVLLSSTELKVIHFANGDEGLTAVLEQRPDMVLLDIMVPGMNGWEVYDKIRANDTVKEMPIIIVTVTPQEIDRRDVFHASKIDFHITKPFDILALRKRIKELLGISEWRVGDKFPERTTSPVKVKPVTDRLRAAAKTAKQQKTS
jgi:DNA-binding response OmpR family regulator